MIASPPEEIAQLMNKVFRFEIGQVVALRIDFTSVEAEFILNSPHKEIKFDRQQRVAQPVALTVIERMIQQCYGGIQLHYKVTGTPGASSVLLEYELMDFAEAVEARKKFRSAGGQGKEP